MIKFLKDSYAMSRTRQNCGDESCCSWMEDDDIDFFKEGEEVDEEYINLDRSPDIIYGVDYICID